MQADSSHLLGSSPKGSFEHELLRFMQMNVSSKRRKSRSRSPGQGLITCLSCAKQLSVYPVKSDRPGAGKHKASCMVDLRQALQGTLTTDALLSSIYGQWMPLRRTTSNFCRSFFFFKPLDCPSPQATQSSSSLLSLAMCSGCLPTSADALAGPHPGIKCIYHLKIVDIASPTRVYPDGTKEQCIAIGRQ